MNTFVVLGGKGLVGNWDTTPRREYTEKFVEVIQPLMQEMRG